MSVCTWDRENRKCLYLQECEDAMIHQRASFYEVCLPKCERMIEWQKREERNDE